MPKGIKKTLNIIAFIVAVVILIFATFTLLLQNSKIQNYVADIVVSDLSSKLNTTVTVDEVEYKFFNTFSFRGLYVEDLDKDTLLYIDHTELGFSLRNLFRGKVIFNQMEINNPGVYLKLDTLGKSNFDFIVKAFTKEEQSSSSNIEYKIRNLEVINSTLSYCKQNGRRTLAPDVLNFDSLQIKNLNASIVLNLLRSDSLNLEISKVNFREKSGFSVDNFSTELIGSTNGLKIDFIDLKLPASHISFDNIKFSYDSLADFKDFANKVDWNVPLKKSVIAFSDLKK